MTLLTSESNVQQRIEHDLPLLLTTPALIGIALISVIGLAPWLPLLDLDEGAFSEATREMLATGNWVSTYLNGEPRHDKPIMIYWLQALSVSAFGAEPFTYRLPSMLAALGWITITYRFVDEVIDNLSARYSVWILASSWLATGIFKAATADALLNLLLCAAFFDVYRYTQKPSQVILVRLGLILGLGFLTKGPVAVLLPGATSLISLVLLGQLSTWLRAVFNPLLLLIFLAVVLPWHVAVYLDQGLEFFKGFYLGHNLSRFSDTMEGHGGSPLYYIALLPLIVAPFTVTFVRVAAEQIKRIGSSQAPLINYLWVWFLLVLTLFSFSQTQLPHYLLYGLTPVFILLAKHLAQQSTAPSAKTWRWEINTTLVFVIALASLPFAFHGFANDSGQIYEQATALLGLEYFYQRFIYIYLAILCASLCLLFNHRLNPGNRLLIGLALLTTTVNFCTLPVVALAQQSPVKAAAEFSKQFPVDTQIVAYKTNMPSFSVYMDQIVRREVPQPGDLIFARIDKLDSLTTEFPNHEVETLFRKGGIAVYRLGTTNDY